MIHIDRGGDWPATKRFFDHLREQGVAFDMIGESYYPFWHGTLDDLRTCLNGVAERYGVPVVIAETDFPSTEKDLQGKPLPPIVGIVPGQEGQIQFLKALKAVLDGVPGGRGAGIFWWAAEYLPLDGVNLAQFEDRSLFDRQGDALPALKVLGGFSKGK